VVVSTSLGCMAIGQCDVRPVVSYIVAGHHCLLAKATLSFLEIYIYIYAYV